MGKSKCANNCTDCFCDVEKYIDETKVDKVALVESIKAKGVKSKMILKDDK